MAVADMTAVIAPSFVRRLVSQPGSWIPFLLILVLGLPTLLYPFGRDQAMFAYVGAVWRHGGLPYRDAWDVKLPGIYAVYALVGGVEWGPRLLDLAACAGTAAALLRLGQLVAAEAGSARRSLGGLAAVLAVVYTLGAFDFWNLAQTETLIAPLSAAAVACGLSRRWYAAGLLAGCAAIIKTTAVVMIVPVFLCCWLPPEPEDSPTSSRVPLATLCGWLTPALLVVGYFAAVGGLPYLGELVATQREYAGGDPRLVGHSPLELPARLGLTGFLPLVAFSVLGVVPSLVRMLRSGGRRLPSAEWILVVWWVIALAQVVVQRRFYLYHWAVLTPPAAWFTAQLAEGAWRAVHHRRLFRGLTLALGLTALVLALAPRWPSWRWLASVASGSMSVSEFKARHVGVFGYNVYFAHQAADHLQNASRPEDRVLVLGFEPEVYLYANRLAPTRHASEAPLFGETSIREARRESWFGELMADLRREPPLYIVDRDVPHVRPPWSSPLQELISGQYHLEAQYGPFSLYRRNGSGPAEARGPA